MRRELIVGARVVIALVRSGIGPDAVVIDHVEVRHLTSHVTVTRRITRLQASITFPGFRMLIGSSARFSVFNSASSAGARE